MTQTIRKAHFRRRLSASAIGRCCLLLLTSFACSNAATAASVDVTKTITWSAPDDLLGDGTVDIGKLKGSYSWLLDVTAVEKKHPINVHLTNPDPTDPKAISGGDWLVMNGLANTAQSLSSKTAPHANSLANITFSAEKPKLNSVVGVIKIHDEAFAVDPNIHGTNSADASSRGTMKIVGTEVTGIKVKGADGKVRIAPAIYLNTLKDQVGITGNASGFVSDPVIIGYSDVDSGATTQSQLFSLDAKTNLAILGWDDTGINIHLQDTPDASASISFNITSDWVNDPTVLASSLTFTKDNFQATGLFASLPWVQHGTEVTLGAGYLDSILLSYRVPLNGALIDDHTYIPTLTMSGQAMVSEAAAVPEPSTLILVVAGLVGLGLRSRRNPHY